jgi:ribosomal protein S18 acetylase RimI-like enzyme
MPSTSSHAIIQAPLLFRAISPADFPLVEQLFGSNGACAGCWCMWWRVENAKSWDLHKGNQNRDDLKQLIESGKVYAILAFDGVRPIGWCTYGPRESFPRLMKSRPLSRDIPPHLWSIICFFIHKNYRRQGIADLLLQKGIEQCFFHGAQEIEAFPKILSDSTKKMNSSDIFTGISNQFEKFGFKPLPREASQRKIYQLLRT